MGLINLDFRYVIEQEQRRKDHRLSQAQYNSTVRSNELPHHYRKFNPWLCLAVMAAALYVLERVVFG